MNASGELEVRVGGRGEVTRLRHAAGTDGEHVAARNLIKARGGVQRA